MKKIRKKIIVNADDFAETEAITTAILACHRAGSVTSTSVIVTTEYWQRGKDLIDENPGLDYGLHLNLTSGQPCSDEERLAPLLEPDGTYPLPFTLLGRLFKACPHRDALEAELFAQAQRLADTGVQITHLDFNDHLFFVGELWEICKRVQHAFGIPNIRRPYQRTSVHPPLSSSSLKRAFLNSWFRGRELDGTVEVNAFDCIGTEKLEETYPAILEGCGELTELIVHPALADPVFADNAYHRCRLYEYDYLSTPKLAELAGRHDIELTTYRDELI